MMIDAVLSYHMNPATCGVAKFNHRLARELGVPCLPLASACENPLLSIKPEEIGEGHIRVPAPRFSLFLHSIFPPPWSTELVERAQRVYTANGVIADHLRGMRPDVIEAWCPSTIDGDPTRAALNVLTFGMAHKLQLPYYEKLKVLLDATTRDYTVSVSTAIHEGSPWDAVANVGDALRAIFGRRTRVLGYLADDALAKELQECHAVALFFDPAVRANNTTFWAAVDAQKLIITNLDAQSPAVYGDVPAPIFDIRTLNIWPSLVVLTSSHGWPRLRQMLR